MFKINIRYPLLAFGLCLSFFLNAQRGNNILENATIGIQTHLGSFITTVPKAAFLKDSYSYFTEINISRPISNLYRSNPSKIPDWGLAIFYGNTGSRNYIGSMKGFFPFIDFKIIALKKFSSNIRTGFGAGFVSNPYNVSTNHKNVLIGSRLNVFINALWKNQFRFSDKWAINAAISFSHLSNGNTSLPNLGLNIPALSGGLSYSMNRKTNGRKKYVDSTTKTILFNVTLSTGIKQSPWINSPRYPTGIIETEIQKQKLPGGRYGAGIAFFFDPSMHHFYLDTIVTIGITNRPAINTGPFISYEKILGKFSIPIKLGVYLFSSEVGRFFQNLGFRYSINNHFSADAGLLAHWGKADFLHAGINYKIK